MYWPRSVRTPWMKAERRVRGGSLTEANGVTPVNGISGPPGLLEESILAGKLTVPIAATFPIERIRDAVAL
jgi:hypothetical protein